jgi:hypothetical protein
MPKQGPYNLKSIPRKALSFLLDDINNTNKSTTVIIPDGGNPKDLNDKIIECGETIPPGAAIWYAGDGIAYNALLAAEYSRPAMSVSVNGGVIGDKIKHRPFGFMAWPGIDNTADNLIYLVSGQPDITDTLIELQTGNYYQILGKIISKDLIFIDIQEALEIL